MSAVFTPHPYQSIMIDYVQQTPRCALYCFMGSGKTSVVLTALDQLSLVEDVYPALVLAPLRVAKTTWPNEVHAWNHLSDVRVVSITGTPAERLAALRTPADVYTANYESIEWLTEQWGEDWPYKTVVADESTRLKSFRLRQGGKRAQALGKVAHRKVTRFIELSGTPVPNGLQDVWAQMWFLDIGERLGRTFSTFTNRWFRPHPSGFGVIPMAHAQEEIQAKLKDICLTIDAKDWFELRDPIVTKVYVDLPTKARQHYRELERELFTELDGGDVEAFGAAARTGKLLQLCNGALYLEGSNTKWEILHDEKIEALKSIIEESAGAPVLVAYHFKSDLDRLQKAFPQARVLDSDPKTIEQWNKSEIPVLLAHPASAGHGLNLQHGGNILVYFAHTWNLEYRQQILERIGPVRQRQAGYDRPVFVYLIIARGTVDEMVISRVDEKQTVQQILLTAMKQEVAHA